MCTTMLKRNIDYHEEERETACTQIDGNSDKDNIKGNGIIEVGDMVRIRDLQDRTNGMTVD